jgi:hypothetical protein
LKHKVSEQLGREPNRTTRVLCKVCGLGFEDSKTVYITDDHHPKRTVTFNDIANIAYDGKLNLRLKLRL